MNINYHLTQVFAIVVISLSLLLLTDRKAIIPTITASSSSSITHPNCIAYDPSERSIRISCKSVHLGDIEHQLKVEDGDDILDKEEDGTWLLNAGLIIEKEPSWNRQTNDYAVLHGNRELNEKLGKFEVEEGFPRPIL